MAHVVEERQVSNPATVPGHLHTPMHQLKDSRQQQQSEKHAWYVQAPGAGFGTQVGCLAYKTAAIPYDHIQVRQQDSRLITHTQAKQQQQHGRTLAAGA